MNVELVPIEAITPYPNNAKAHPKTQVEKIANSIQEFGFSQPVVATRDGVVVVGHGRLEAAKFLKLKDIPVLYVDLTDEQARAYRLADNKLNESKWDMDLVIEELKSLSEPMLDLTGFNKDLVIEPEDMDDEVPEQPEEPRSAPGDIYELGRHRVMCGDSTSVDAVETLMTGMLADVVVTDPPYNTGMGGKGSTFDYDWSKKKAHKSRLSHMFNDAFTDEQWHGLLEDVFASYMAFSKGDCAFYVFIDWRRVGEIRTEMEKHMAVKNVIVWDKKVHGLGSDYKSTYELCIVGKKGEPEINNRFGLDYQDIWRLQRTMGRNKDHATVKPVELLEKPIMHASKQDDIVLDLFLGSGSTLIAAQKTGRACYGMELDPKYVDVIVRRYVDYTGNKEIVKNGEPMVWE